MHAFCTFMMLLSTLAVDVEVRTIDGVAVRGQLIALDESQVELTAQDGTETQLPIESVLSVTRSAEPVDKQTVEVMLVCGSTLSVHDICCSNTGAAIQSTDGTEISVPVKVVRSVRFVADTALIDQWRDLLASDLTGDVVVIRRAESLDYLEGLVRSVDQKQVAFEYEGDVLDIPRTKLEGIIFFRTRAPQEAAIKLSTTGSCSLQLDSMRIEQGTIIAKTLSGVMWEIPLDQMTRINFAEGKVLYLGDVTPHEIKVGSSGPSSVQARALEQLLYQPRSNASLFGDRLALRMPGDEGVKLFSKGLAMHSRTEITYRLDNEYAQLRGLVGMDPRSAARGLVKLEVFSGRRRIFSREISVADDPIELSLDVAGTKRLRILVDYADNWDLSDHLNLCNLRLTK